MADKQMTIVVNVTDEWREAIEWNCNDSKPMTDDQIREYLWRELLKDSIDLIQGRHGYRESQEDER